MRNSYWSSSVCSSDLLGNHLCFGLQVQVQQRLCMLVSAGVGHAVLLMQVVLFGRQSWSGTRATVIVDECILRETFFLVQAQPSAKRRGRWFFQNTIYAGDRKSTRLNSSH